MIQIECNLGCICGTKPHKREDQTEKVYPFIILPASLFL
ncbi:hypothetical protein D1BOALGB6SA_10071 [Olavius sp. associated proteobacterium Delta 1]|nr:hypothetical protein D1BOALGB6SA_10071 [Olavius sp. associated proteobacterium Delta 1]